MQNKYYIESTLTLRCDFEVMANSKEEAENHIRTLQWSDKEEKMNSVKRVRINQLTDNKEEYKTI
jgi:predicted small metal-binding protein